MDLGSKSYEIVALLDIELCEGIDNMTDIWFTFYLVFKIGRR